MLTRVKTFAEDVSFFALCIAAVILGGAAILASYAMSVIGAVTLGSIHAIAKSRVIYFAAGFVAGLLVGCPGQGEETAPGDPETCCACLYDAFPEVGEPCIYESANSCQGHVKAGVGPDTWGVCLAELCGDVCDGVGPFDVIRWEP